MPIASVVSLRSSPLEGEGSNRPAAEQNVAWFRHALAKGVVYLDSPALVLSNRTRLRCWFGSLGKRKQEVNDLPSLLCRE